MKSRNFKAFLRLFESFGHRDLRSRRGTLAPITLYVSRSDNKVFAGGYRPPSISRIDQSTTIGSSSNSRESGIGPLIQTHKDFRWFQSACSNDQYDAPLSNAPTSCLWIWYICRIFRGIQVCIVAEERNLILVWWKAVSPYVIEDRGKDTQALNHVVSVPISRHLHNGRSVALNSPMKKVWYFTAAFRRKTFHCTELDSTEFVGRIVIQHMSNASLSFVWRLNSFLGWSVEAYHCQTYWPFPYCPIKKEQCASHFGTSASSGSFPSGRWANCDALL